MIKSFASLAILFLFSACSKTPPPPVAPAAPAATASVEGAAEPAPPPPPAPENAASNGSVAPADSGDRLSLAEAQGVDLADLDYALHAFVGAFKRYPKSVEEMVSMKALAAMPKVPAGKRLVVNQQSKTVELVSQ